MPRKAKELGPLAVSKLTKPGRWSVGGVDGLAMSISDTGARSWVLRVSVAGRRREAGLGSFPSVTLAGAREAARAHRAIIVTGGDPISQRRAAVSAAAAEHSSQRTFKWCAAEYIKAHENAWRNAKHGTQWTNTLKTYAEPVIGSLLVRDITPAHVLQVVEPIWATKTETASRVRNRIELVLDWAKARGFRAGENPAAWKGNLDATLPSAKKVAKREHHRAVPVSEVGAFIAKLRAVPGVSARALEVVALTAVRTGEVRGMKWNEADLDAKLWIVPKERTKTGLQHRVTLSTAAVKLLRSMPKGKPADLVFPGRNGGPLSDMSLNQTMRRMGIDGVPHGLRATFKTWAHERSAHAEEAIKLAMGHVVGDAVTRAYLRGDLLEKRRKLAEDWAGFLSRVEQKSVGKVVSLASRRRDR